MNAYPQPGDGRGDSRTQTLAVVGVMVALAWIGFGDPPPGPADRPVALSAPATMTTPSAQTPGASPELRERFESFRAAHKELEAAMHSGDRERIADATTALLDAQGKLEKAKARVLGLKDSRPEAASGDPAGPRAGARPDLGSAPP